MGITAREFIKGLSVSTLLSNNELSDINQQFNEQLSEDGEAIARRLIKQGKITKFQALNIYQGRAKGLIFGEYVVLDKIGSGGMGHVYKAQHRRMKRLAAIKVLSSQLTSCAKSIKRFYQEVEVAAKLQHPNIVATYDASEAHGVHFLIMEYVEGCDLAVRLKKQGPLTVEQAVNCIHQAARGLEYAHSQDVVHRDIKPGNLLVNRQGVVKVLDMGLARFNPLSEAAEPEKEGLTESGQVLGTADYMAPEQAADIRTADHRADIYSLGCTLYRLMTGDVPYPGDTVIKKILAHRTEPIPSLRAACPQVSRSLDAFFQRMIAKLPEERVQTMTEVVQTFEAILAGQSEEDSSISVLDEPQANDELQSFLKAIQSPLASSSSGISLTGNTISGSLSATKHSFAPPKPANRKLLAAYAGIAAAVIVAFSLFAWLSRGEKPAGVAGVAERKATPADESPREKKKSPFSSNVAKRNEPAKPTPASETVIQILPERAITPPVPQPPAEVAKSDPPLSTTAANTPPPPKLPPAVKRLMQADLWEPIDLLAIVDVKHHAYRGAATREGSVLSYSVDRGGAHYVPIIPPDEYDLAIDVEMPKDSAEILIGMSVKDKWCELRMHPSGFSLAILGSTSENPSRRLLSDVQGKVMRAVLVAVRRDRMLVRVDNEVKLFWTELDKLAPSNESRPGFDALYLNAPATRIKVTRWELIPPAAVIPPLVPLNLLARSDPAKVRTSGVWNYQRYQLVGAYDKGLEPRMVFSSPVAASYSLQVDLEHTGLYVRLRTPRVGGFTRVVYSPNTGGTDLRNTTDTSTLAASVLPFPLQAFAPHSILFEVAGKDVRLASDGRQLIHRQLPVEPGERNVPLDSIELDCVRGTGMQNCCVAVERAILIPAGFRRLSPPPEDDNLRATEALSPQLSQVKKSSPPEMKIRAAESLWRFAALNLDDAAQRFVALQAAVRLAGEAGELPLAFNAAQDLIATWDINEQELESRIVAETFKAKGSQAARNQLVADAFRLMNRTASQERLHIAIDLQSALAGVVKPATSDLAREIKTRGVELNVAISEFNRAQAAQTTLATQPDYPNARLDIGRYLALILRDYERAREYLQKTDNAQWMELVEHEIKASENPTDQAAQGDRWWALAESEAAPLKWLFAERAGEWYARCLHRVSGSVRTAVNNRVNLISQQRKQSGAAFAQRHPLDAFNIAGRWYKFFPLKVKRLEARQLCDRMGGRLPVLDSAEQSAALAQYLSSSGIMEDKDRDFWTALSDSEKEGDFRWDDGRGISQTVYTAWAEGQPKNAPSDDVVRAYLKAAESPLRIEWSIANDSNQTVSFIVCQWDQ